MASSSTPARQAHGEVAQGDTHRAVVVNGVSSDDEPSVEWGWHGHYPKVARLAGFVAIIVTATDVQNLVFIQTVCIIFDCYFTV